MQKVKAEFVTNDEVRLAGSIELDGIVDAQTINGVAINNSCNTGLVLTGIDGANSQWAAGGAYTPPITFEQVADTGPLNLNDAASGTYSWAHAAGAALLDYSVPALPTIVTTGVYVLALNYTGNLITPTGFYIASLEMDVTGEDLFLSVQSAPANASAGTGTFAALTGALYLPAGAQLQASITNHDGVANRDFIFGGYLQRLS